LRHSDAVISCYHGDEGKIKELSAQGISAAYIPWPSGGQKISEDIPQVRGRAVFIGAFDPHKNLEECLLTIPRLLSQAPLNEFYFIGDGHSAPVVDELLRKYPHAIRHVKSMSREDCLRLISSSFFCYSPAVDGGWGFIGDAWSMKRPLVTTHNHYGFRNGIDSIVTDDQNIGGAVRRLYDDKELYHRIAEGGFLRFKNSHSPENVGIKYLEVCLRALNKTKTGWDY
jgi:glycosyltransferase involved in cell wall biosynthesis